METAGKVLIVEDDPGVLRLEELGLKRAGFEVRTASSADAARHIIAGGGIDLVVLDYSLDGEQSGIEFYRSLQQGGRAVPAILVTGFSDEDRIIEAMRAGIRDFLPKRADYLDTLPICVGRVMKQIHNERNLALAELRRQDVEAENRAKDEFLAVLSHEMRTPLSAMLGWIKLIQSGRLDEANRRRGIEVIERNVRAQTRLVDDLLEVSRIVCGKLELVIDNIDVWRIVSEAVEAMRPTAVSRNVSLDCRLMSPDFRGQGDADRLRQVVTNLISNAVKFTPSGGKVTIECSRAGTNLKIQVTDTGIGIDASFLPHVFDRFRQADVGITRTYQGLGLGLTIVRHLVELHGGTIQAESKGKGQGARFTVTLPPTVKIKGQETPPPERVSSTPAAEGALAGVKTLIIEDNADSRELLRILLVESGAEVLAAANAEEAMRLFESRSVDIVLSDLSLPDEDGFDLLKRIRHSPRGGDIPVIALTALASLQTRQRVSAAGFQAYITKPFEPRELINTVLEYVRAAVARKN